MENTQRKVVVTGLGLATPLGIDLEQTWRRTLDGVSGIRELTLPDSAKSPVRAVGEVKAADWARIREEFREEAEKEAERRTLFALWSAKAALRDADFEKPDGPGDRYGVFQAAGLGINCLEDIRRWTTSEGRFDCLGFGREIEQSSPEAILKNHSNRPAALIGEKFGLHGANCTVTSACASATQAIGLAFRAIRMGEADLIVAGGADSMINPVGLVFFVLLGAAATSGAFPPEQVSRPFDRKRLGLVMGEGAGFAILEEESHALKRGARIYAEVAGYGSTLDAYRLTAPQPRGEGAAGSILAALKDAGVAPDEIDYINAHATSTKLNDAIETAAVKQVFGSGARSLCISSSKSMIGHLLAASGGPEFAFTVLSVQRDEIHPTINLTNPDPKCDLDCVPNVMRRKTVRAALSNSFGFGGQNASVVVRKYPG